MKEHMSATVFIEDLVALIKELIHKGKTDVQD
jgi:hypothetical protein